MRVYHPRHGRDEERFMISVVEENDERLSRKLMQEDRREKSSISRGIADRDLHRACFERPESSKDVTKPQTAGSFRTIELEVQQLCFTSQIVRLQQSEILESALMELFNVAAGVQSLQARNGFLPMNIAQLLGIHHSSFCSAISFQRSWLTRDFPLVSISMECSLRFNWFQWLHIVWRSMITRARCSHNAVFRFARKTR